MELRETVIELDEFEAMRLCDLEGLDQTAAGGQMGVSRGTIQRLLERGRWKLLEALLGGAAIRINHTGGATKDEDMHSHHGE